MAGRKINRGGHSGPPLLVLSHLVLFHFSIAYLRLHYGEPTQAVGQLGAVNPAVGQSSWTPGAV